MTIGAVRARCHAGAGQLDRRVRHRILVHERMLELAKCFDCLESACYPKRNGGTRQIGGLAFVGGRVRSVTVKKWQTLHPVGAATIGAASAGLPDTSAAEVALIAEVLRRFNCDAEKPDLVQFWSRRALPVQVQRQATVSSDRLHLYLKAVALARSLVFDA